MKRFKKIRIRLVICKGVVCIIVVDGMKHIQDVEMDLTMANLLCSNSKRIVEKADEEIIHSIFETVAQVKRRRHFMEVIALLQEIESIIELEEQIKILLQAGDYTQAMEFYLTGYKMQASLERFSCMSELRVRFRNGQQEILNLMHAEARSVANNFNLKKFQNIAKVYAGL